MDFEVVVSPLAKQDLEEIFTFIADDNPSAGERVIRNIVFKIESLVKYPRIGKVVPEFNREPLREISETPYRIIYWLNENEQQIEIVRVWHAARGMPKLDPH